MHYIIKYTFHNITPYSVIIYAPNSIYSVTFFSAGTSFVTH